MSILKNTIKDLPLDIEFNVEELLKESAYVEDKLLQANNVLFAMLNDENLNNETAIAYALPLYDYDRSALLQDLEIMTVENAEMQVMAQSADITTRIVEVIKKLFRIFYNMFKQLQQKLILWLNGIKPFIGKMEEKIKTTDFSKSEDFNDKDRSSIANAIGVYSLFNGKLSDDSIARILTSVKNLKTFETSLNNYNEFMSNAKKALLNSDDFEQLDKEIGGDSSIGKKFFESLPKFYKDISEHLEHYTNDKVITTSIKFGKEDLGSVYVVSTDGKNLNIIYNAGRQNTLLIKHTTGHINADKIVDNVTLKPLDKTKIEMLLKTIKENDIESLSKSIRTAFGNMESNLNTIMKDLSHKNFKTTNGEMNVTAQFIKAIFSDNVSTLNGVTFNYINQNAKLIVGILKLIELSLGKYPTAEVKPDPDQKQLK